MTGRGVLSEPSVSDSGCRAGATQCLSVTEHLHPIAPVTGLHCSSEELVQGDPPHSRGDRYPTRALRLLLFFLLEKVIVLRDELPNLVGHAEQLLPLLLVKRDGEAS
jgi:hypothetical protein